MGDARPGERAQGRRARTFRNILVTAAAACALAGAAAAQPAPGSPPPAPPPGDHIIAVTNSGGSVVSAISVATAGSLDYTDDLLGKQVASVGKTVKLKVKDPTGACVFDVQFLLSDGTSVTRKNVNFCQTDSYTFTR
jgi:hypothetical protein